MDRPDTKTVNLILNSEQAKSKLDELKKELEQVKEAKKEALEKHDAKAVSEAQKLIRQLGREIAKVETRAEGVTRTLENLDKASPKELKATIKAINKELDSGSVERGSKEWEALQRALGMAEAELNKIKVEQRAVTSMKDDVAEWGNKWEGTALSLTLVANAIDRVMGSASGNVELYAEMSEHMSDVKKYTGLAEEQVKELNDAFKNIDTRTSRERLNDLAADAGKLGENTKAAAIEFADAANQIHTSLGKELGDDGVKNIGKLAQLFGDADKMGLKKGMLAVASVINDLAQSSNASEPYILDFTSRMAGAGKTAGMSSAQIMAFASVLDQSAIQSEKAATALGALVQKMFREPAQMAQAVGIPIKEFTDLLNKDANAALVKWLDAVNKMGGMSKIAPMLGELQLTGAGVSDVIAALANNIDNLRNTQIQANTAFQEASSITNEYNAANSTKQAAIEKLEKKTKDLRIELGEKLYPIMMSGMSLQNKILQIIIAMINFGAQHLTSIIAITSAIALQTVAINYNKIAVVAHSVATKAGTVAMGAFGAVLKSVELVLILCTNGLKAARTAFLALNRTMKLNIFGLIASAITTVIVVISELIHKEKELTAEQKKRIQMEKDQLDLEKRASNEVSKQTNRINILTSIIHDNAVAIDKRREAVEALKKIIPDYNAEITNEGVITRENTDAVKDYVTELKKAALARAVLAKTDELTAQLLGLQESKSRRESAVRRRTRRLEEFKGKNPALKNWMEWVAQPGNEVPFNTEKVTGGKRAEAVKLIEQLREAQGWVTDIDKQISATNQRIKNITDTAKKMGVGVNDFVKDDDDDNGTVGGGGMSDDAIKKAVQEIRNKAEQKRQMEDVQYEIGAVNHKQHMQNLYNIDAEMYASIKKLYAKNSKEWLEAERARMDAASKLKKEQHAWSLEELKIEENDEREQMKQNFLDGTIDEEQYQKKLSDIRLKYLKKKADMYRQWGMDSEADEAQRAYEEAAEAEQIQRQQDFWKKVDSFKKEFLKLSAEEQQNMETRFAEELHTKGLLSEEEYQKALKAIREKYQKGGKDEQDGYKWEGGSPSDPLSNGVINIIQQIQNLQDKLKEGKASWQDFASVGVASLSMVSAIASSASSLIQANLAIEEKKVNQRYDTEVKQAGNNKKKTKKLEEARQKELAALKSKYAKKQMAMQITQAIASTAQNALMAYGSVLIPGVPWTYPLAAIAAAAAVASGMIQVAAIKKQASAQQGYYEGGFTGGNRYRKEAGVVHEGEFVANHLAVENPAVYPFLNLLDYAQRNNTVSSLTPGDISRMLPASQGAIGQNTVQVIDSSSYKTGEAIERLNENLKKGIYAKVILDGEDGLDRNWKKYNDLKNV